VIRLLTPRGKNYEQTYRATFPFNKEVEGMLSGRTFEELNEIMRDVLQEGRRIYLFINNRANGNAPQTARRISYQLLNSLDPTAPRL
jgi:uncharacterized protein YecE (DUF72 family)